MRTALWLWLIVFALVLSAWAKADSLGISSKLTAKLTDVLSRASAFYMDFQSKDDLANAYAEFFFRTQSESAVMLRDCRGSCTRDPDSSDRIKLFVVTTDVASLNHTVHSYIDFSGTFVFIITDDISLADVEDSLRYIWNRFEIYRVFFLTPGGAFLYNPFYLSPDTGGYGQASLAEDMPRQGLFKNLNKHPLTVQMFRSVYAKPVFAEDTGLLVRMEGVDAKVAYLLEKKMNFTMLMQEPDPDFFGDRNNDGTYFGTLGRLVRREVDLALTGFFVKDYLTTEIEFSVGVYTDKMCCYVPKADRIPKSILPLFSVDLLFWAAFIFAGFACGLVWILFRAANLSIFKSTVAVKEVNALRILNDAWVVWVRVGLSRFPPYSSECLFIMFMSFLSVIFGAIFESSLATVYIKPLYYKDINSLQELEASGLTIYYRHAAMKHDLFMSETADTLKQLQKKLKFAANTKNPLIQDMATKGGFASVTRESSLKMDDILYFMSGKIHMVPQCPRDYEIAYVFPKNSPYSKRINFLLLKLIDAGLIDHWIGDMTYRARLSAINTIIAFETTETRRILNLSDVQLAFHVVHIGALLGGLTLIAEICWKRWSK